MDRVDLVGPDDSIAERRVDEHAVEDILLLRGEYPADPADDAAVTG